jgi:DNA adenine methylase
MSHPNEYILSYNDCPTIREWYKKDVQLFPKWHYSYQQGELRIGKNRISEGKISPTKESHEILIINTKSSDRDVNSFFQFGV